MEKRHTKLGNSYWNNTGAYEKEYSELWDKLVPLSGDAPTVHGEMLRAIGRIAYDYANNGNINLLEHEKETCSMCGGSGQESNSGYRGDDDDDDEESTCTSCDGTGEEEGDLYITEYYEKMFDFLEEFMTDNTNIFELRYWLLRRGSFYDYKYGDEEMNYYDKVFDDVIYQILTTENQPNPQYTNED
jgi:hypothetical protein